MNRYAKALINLQNTEFDLSDMKQQKGANPTPVIQRLRARVTNDLLKEYDNRKRRFGATSVVPITGSFCSGCRVKLSLGTRRRAHDHVTECEHCARLVYNPARKQKIKMEIV